MRTTVIVGAEDNPVEGPESVGKTAQEWSGGRTYESDPNVYDTFKSMTQLNQ